MPVKAVNIGKYGYMLFSFGCVMAVYSGGIYMKFAVFLSSDNSACNFFRNNATFLTGATILWLNATFFGYAT